MSPTRRLAALRLWLRKLGPGLITGAADDDPSGIGTYSQAGAQFGFAPLWMLLPGERGAMAAGLVDVLAGYEAFRELDRRELHLIEALRTLRLLHYSAWIARRWDDPAFPAAFPWFNTQHYWQDRVLELREQIALMQEPPLWQS